MGFFYVLESCFYELGRVELGEGVSAENLDDFRESNAYVHDLLVAVIRVLLGFSLLGTTWFGVGPATILKVRL